MADTDPGKEKPEDSTGDLSSLIEAPAPAIELSASPEPAAEPAETAEPKHPAPPIQFESLDEFSHEAGAPAPEQEAPLSGLDLSLVDGPAPAAEPGIDSIKKYSDNLAIAEPQVAASFPFTLKIEGRLAPEDAEKLLSILSRENMGFREVDLEPQIAEGKILIPRISEYAGVLLVQALRSIPARISFGPSDEIFSTPDTRDDPATSDDFAGGWNAQGDAPAMPEDIAKLPVTNAATLPQFPRVEAIDTLVASGLLTTRALEARHSEEYAVLLEALIRELRFKAHRRGANGILALRVQLTPLTLPTDYRVTVTATAVRGSV